MATWDNIAHNAKDTLESLTEGWQELWNKARNSITHFTPNSDDGAPAQRSAWGVLSAEMQETEKTLVVSIEALGMESGAFNIRVEGNALYIFGKRSYEKQREQRVITILLKEPMAASREQSLCPVMLMTANQPTNWKEPSQGSLS